jgi:putative hydrolase of the HAD superfamily
MTDFSRIEAILFDAGQTFLFPDFPFLKNLLAEYGGNGYPSAAKGGRWRGKNFPSPRKGELERLSHILDAIRRRAGAGDSRNFNADFERHKREHLWSWPDPAAKEVFAKLKNLGYRLGVISNSDGSIASAMKKLGFAPFFDCMIDSHVVGVEKPDPRIFEMALQQLGLPAERCVYVGDNYDRDVIGARGAGLVPILIDPFDLVAEDEVRRIRELGELARVLKDGARESRRRA